MGLPALWPWPRGTDGRTYRILGAALGRSGARYYARGDGGDFYWLVAAAIRVLVEGVLFQAEPQPAAEPGVDGRPADCPASDWVTAPEGQVIEGRVSDGTGSTGSPAGSWAADAGGGGDGGSSD